jgi:hypothetical protein
LKNKIDNKENLYDNRPITAAREGEKIVIKSSPSYTVRVPYTTDIAYDEVLQRGYDASTLDQIKYTQQRIEALTVKYKQGISAHPYRTVAEQQRIFRTAYSGKSYSYDYYDEYWPAYDRGWLSGERVEVKQSAIVDHIET